MRSIASASAWVCMLIVALPLSPCAFFSSGCCPEQESARPQAVATERPCCAHHADSAGQPQGDPATEHSRSCDRECCQLSPFVPPVQKVLDEAPLAHWAMAAPEANFDSASGPVLDVPRPFAETIPLQILHCQWRC